MFDLSAYALRFLEYLVIMVLFGVPLFGWYGSRRSALADALAGWSLMGVLLAGAVAGLVLTGLDVVSRPRASWECRLPRLIAHRLAGICSRRPRAGQPWREARCWSP